MYIYMCIFLQPTLDRQVSKTAVEEPETSVPTEGEGSEYGRKWKDEVRKKRRGYRRRQDPDDNPWVLKEKKRGGKQ
jgi:transcription initiation factor TFIIF subunit alpha